MRAIHVGWLPGSSRSGVLSQHGAPIAPSTYYAAKSRPASARAVHDRQLRAEITRVWKENREVYGADKVWLELNRQGITVARCTTERLMRELSLQGVRRGRKVRITLPRLLLSGVACWSRSASESAVACLTARRPSAASWRSFARARACSGDHLCCRIVLVGLRLAQAC